MTQEDVSFSHFVKNLVKTACYVSAIVITTWGAFEFKQLMVDNKRATNALTVAVANTLPRADAERMLKMANARFKRVYDRNGWVYEPIE